MLWREGKIIILSSNTPRCCLTITGLAGPSPDAPLMEVQPIRSRSGPSNLVSSQKLFLDLLHSSAGRCFITGIFYTQAVRTHSIMEGFIWETKNIWSGRSPPSHLSRTWLNDYLQWLPPSRLHADHTLIVSSKHLITALTLSSHSPPTGQDHLHSSTGLWAVWCVPALYWS